MVTFDLDLSKYDLGWSDEVEYAFTPEKGINPGVVEQISWWKGEPRWMTQFRQRSLKLFERKPMAEWFAVNMPDIDFQDIYYYLRPKGEQVDEWDQLPEEMMRTYEKLGIPEAERQYLAGVTAQYECLRGSTQVWTTRGMRAIKELEAGDEVFSLDPESKRIVVGKVVGQACSGDKEIFEITAGTRTIGASGNHPFLVLRDHRRPGRQRARYRAEWVAAEDLRVGDYVAVATDLPDYGRPGTLVSRDAHLGLGVTDPDLLWFVGVYLGDGYIHHRRERSGRTYPAVEIAVDRRDPAFIAEIQRVASEQFGLDFALSADEMRLVARGSRRLVEFLDANGLGGVSLTKRIPGWVYALSHDERLAFLAGFVDADGTVRAHRSAKNPVVTSANEALLEDVRELALLCGIHAGRVRAFHSKHPFDADRTLVGYRLHLSGRFDRLPLRSWKRERLDQRVYAHGNRTAKGTDFRTHTSEMLGFVRVDSVVPAGVEPTYDIEVAGHHNFVAEGFVVHNSEVVYHKNREDLEKQGILFCDMDTALREYPHIVKQYFGTVIPPGDNKFAALNTAVWSGGSFIYVPPGVNCEMPLQAYFRINSENAGQFERTLIIADEGAQVHYIEGCSAPVYTSDSLHSAVVEIIVKPHARVTYTTIQNWSPNVYNLVTKRARVEAHGHMEWIDGNIGSKLTMKYPSVYLVGEGATGEVLSVAYAGAGQHQDAGAKMIHAAPNTSSKIVSKSISKDGGKTTYRGLVRVDEGAHGCKSHVQCDALILDEDSVSKTFPYMEVGERDAQIGHEATVSKIADEQIFYLMSRGLSEEQAMGMVVNGFIEPVTRTLPMEYAVEWSRLIELQMEGSVG
jgi:Fe-S cluster assembly protein SufB